MSEPSPAVPSIAYFSMEVALDDRVPTFSGGLGVLAGDHLRAAADLGIDVVGVTLLYRGGYFRQQIDDAGQQHEEPVFWAPDAVLEQLDVHATVTVSGRDVVVAVWRFVVEGVTGHRVPVLLLDTDVDGNAEDDRRITDRLYGGDVRHRLRQEAILGLGGMAVLAALGWPEVPTVHMNEGHSALLTLAALREHITSVGESTPDAAQAVRSRCVFTTHTPVPAGHDRFERDVVHDVLGEELTADLDALGCWEDGELNMTRLGLGFSRFVNAVSVKHAEVTREMFPDVVVRSVTNGVHAATWVAPPMAEVLDRHLEGWRLVNTKLRSASVIPLDELDEAHRTSKARLLALVAERTGVGLDRTTFTIGVARRAAAYKRLDLLLRDPDRLRMIATRVGPMHVIYSGKAHPRDDDGKAAIKHILDQAKKLEGLVETVFVEDYSLEVARAMCAGTDLWLNTPERPYEASGTSGMKAALNGVPSLSVLDGWWIEGHIEGVTGWSIGEPGTDPSVDAEVDDVYDKLENEIVPIYYERPTAYAAIRRLCVALNGSYFNTERMVREYAAEAYRSSTA